MPHHVVRTRRWAVQLALAGLILLLLGSLSFLKANRDPDVIAVVNGQELTRDAFYSALEQMTVDGESLGSIALRQMITEALIAQAGSKYDLGVTDELVQQEFESLASFYGPDFEAILEMNGISEERLKYELRINLIVDRLLIRGIEVTDDEVREFYDNNKADFFVEPEQYRVSQIMVNTEEEANAILERLAAGETFAELREELSLDKEDWGLISSYTPLPSAVMNAILDLEVGEVSAPIQLSTGFYLVRVEEIIPSVDIPFEEVAADIRDHLLYSQAPTVDELLDSLWNEAKIQVNWDRYKFLATTSEE